MMPPRSELSWMKGTLSFLLGLKSDTHVRLQVNPYDGVICNLCALVDRQSLLGLHLPNDDTHCPDMRALHLSAELFQLSGGNWFRGCWRRGWSNSP